MIKAKYIFILAAFLSAIFFIASCKSNTAYKSDFKVAATPTATPYVAPTFTAKDGLDLEAVGEMAKKVKDAAGLERKLNEKNGINNLDLDKDGKVDYISVFEFKDKNEIMRGYSLAVKFDKNSIQEIATIILKRANPQAKTINVVLDGSDQIYGENNYYEGEWMSDEAVFDDWAYSVHEYYVSAYYIDHYPGDYYFPVTSDYEDYRRRTYDWRKNSKFKKVIQGAQKTEIVSPNAGKTVTNIKAKLINPTKAQTTYQTKTLKTSSTDTASADTKSDKQTNPSTSSTPNRSLTSNTSSTDTRTRTDYPSTTSTPYTSSTPYKSSSTSSSSTSSSSTSSSSSSSSKKSSSSSSSRRKP